MTLLHISAHKCWLMPQTVAGGVVRLVLLVALLLNAHSAHAQHFAISNNVIFDAAGMLSAGVEIPCSKKISVEAYGAIRPWRRGERDVHKSWALQGQVRFWPCKLMNGFFWGPYAHLSAFNYGNRDLFFGIRLGKKDHRYEGWLIGGGMGIGYEYVLAKHWNICAEVGAGYTYIDRKTYSCEVCGSMKGSEGYHYFGISKLGLSLIYVF